MAAYKNLDYCVKNVQDDLKDYTTHCYARLLRISYRIFSELNLNVMPNIKVLHTTPDDIGCVAFPIDYEYYTKIGVCIGGRIYTLTRNDDLCLVGRKKDDCGLTLSDVSNDTDSCLCTGGYLFMPHWYGGFFYTAMYGMGGGINSEGYYRVDHEMRRLQFNSVIPQTELIIEYKSNGLQPDGSAIIPGRYVAAMIEGIHWKNLEYDRTVSQSEKDRRYQMFCMEYDKLVTAVNSFTLDEYEDAMWTVLNAGVLR